MVSISARSFKRSGMRRRFSRFSETTFTYKRKGTTYWIHYEDGIIVDYFAENLASGAIIIPQKMVFAIHLALKREGMLDAPGDPEIIGI